MVIIISINLRNKDMSANGTELFVTNINVTFPWPLCFCGIIILDRVATGYVGFKI